MYTPVAVSEGRGLPLLCGAHTHFLPIYALQYASRCSKVETQIKTNLKENYAMHAGSNSSLKLTEKQFSEINVFAKFKKINQLIKTFNIKNFTINLNESPG